MNDDVQRRALELERELYYWVERDNTPDVVLDEDGGLSWGSTFNDAESPEVQEELEASERRLYDYLRTHRSELQSESRWRMYFDDIDLRAEQARPIEPDPAEQRRSDRARWAEGSGASPPPAAPDAGQPRGMSR